MKNWNLVLAAGACAALASIASATPQETFNFAPVDTNGPNGDASNGVATHDFVGGYNVGTIRLTGSLVSVNAATYGGEARVVVTAPSGASVTFTPFPGELTFGQLDAFDIILPIAETAGAGTWVVRCYETFDDGGTASVDATWTDLQITLDDEVPPPPPPPDATPMGIIDTGVTVSKTVDFGPGEVKYFSLTIPSAVPGADHRAVNIDTLDTFGVDTEIGLWSLATGTLIADDDDSAGNLLSILSFGEPIGGNQNGQDGPLAAGDYILSVSQFNTTFGDGFSAVSTAGGSGTFTVNARGTDSTPTPPGPGEWSETYIGIDAGELPGGAQVCAGSGSLTTITGRLTADEADMYQIEICDYTTFSATTVGLAGFDTQLFLFNDATKGVVLCDDDINSGTLQSALTATFVGANGTYYLAISQYNRDPDDGAGSLLWENVPFNVERAPDGPAASSNIGGWQSGGGAGGSYQIALTGACFVGPAGCPADFDGDGTVDFFDYDAFVVCFEDPDCTNADFDGDGTVDFFDYDAFVVAFETPCP
ncbi:MAG: DVUA0089 family protein [Planctomycetota bacterium]